MAAAFLMVRAGEGALCILLLAWVAARGEDPLYHAATWARHELLYGFMLVQAAVWKVVGRMIELRLIILTLAVGIYAFVAYYPLAFVLCFIAAQTMIELGVWWRMQRV